MTREKVLAWLRRHDSTPLLFSDLSRALITNDKKQRARSLKARAELRLVLASLRDDGLVSLTTRPDGRSGVTVTVLQTDAT